MTADGAYHCPVGSIMAIFIIILIIIIDICIIIISLVVAICTARPSVIGLACRCSHCSSSVTNRAIRIDLRFPPQEGKYCQICAGFAFASNLLTYYFSQNKKAV